ncbi:MAG: hypothetical protein CM1200mP39_24250 [Dehalococcoidia bacterium]|nr:MAG: hypothetical protein CM1200mP39_24250 [Dehalococcoidia bacterium]
MTRGAANAGDLVCVTGPLGGLSGGLETLLSGKDKRGKEVLINRHFHPPLVSNSDKNLFNLASNAEWI